MIGCRTYVTAARNSHFGICLVCSIKLVADNESAVGNFVTALPLCGIIGIIQGIFQIDIWNFCRYVYIGKVNCTCTDENALTMGRYIHLVHIEHTFNIYHDGTRVIAFHIYCSVSDIYFDVVIVRRCGIGSYGIYALYVQRAATHFGACRIAAREQESTCCIYG